MKNSFFYKYSRVFLKLCIFTQISSFLFLLFIFIFFNFIYLFFSFLKYECQPRIWEKKRKLLYTIYTVHIYNVYLLLFFMISCGDWTRKSNKPQTKVLRNCLKLNSTHWLQRTKAAQIYLLSDLLLLRSSLLSPVYPNNRI